MWRFKACPKCKGDMWVEHGSDGKRLWCLQCGYRVNSRDLLQLRQAIVALEVEGLHCEVYKIRR